MSDNETTSNARKGIYFLPSLFTTAGLFFGFYAIIQATHGEFGRAALAIFVAMIMDGLDGRVARWTNTASDFGKEYDSLVDLVAFGLAPALVIYFWSLQSIGRAGWLIAFIYAAATALRLARFNTLVIKESRYFFGLPSPSAGAFVVFWVWCMYDFKFGGYESTIAILSALVTLSAAVLMVSNVKFRSFKDFDHKNKVPFVVLIVLILVFVLVFFDPPTVLFLIAFGYAASGPLSWLWRWRKGDQESPAFLPDDHDDSDDPIEGIEQDEKN